MSVAAAHPSGRFLLARAVGVVLATTLLFGADVSRGGAPAVPLTLATATTGGGFEAYGRAFAEIVNAADPGLAVMVKPSAGSIENLALLRARKVDLALVTGEVAQEALAAQGDGAEGLRVLSVMYAAPGLFAVRADSPYRRIEDLKGRPVVFGARGSGLVVLARQVLDALGLDLERDFEAILLDRAEDGPAMVLDGRAEALWGGGGGWPPFVALAASGARFLAPDDDGVRRIVGRHPFLKPMTLPAGAYAGQNAPIRSVGSWSLILVRPGLAEDIGYRLARALHRSEDALARRLPRAAETTAANTLAAVPSLHLHSGVRRHLAERDLPGAAHRP